MIIFDLDGTLADCEHRRHFVDPRKRKCCQSLNEMCYKCKDWQPDYQAFYEACDKDEPIKHVIEIFESLVFENDLRLGNEIEIWSGRCESVREKTQDWLDKNVWGSPSVKLKMRPIRDSTPDDELKEKWLDELCWYYNDITGVHEKPHGIQMVFDDRPKVIRMWQRRNVFVFNCCQHDKEF